MKISVKILGSGGSFGTPGIGCKCPACTSSNPKDRRLRSSCLVKANDKTYLIDTCPDVRYMFLKYEITHIDRVLLTHHHEDHVGGLNELRPLYLNNGEVPIPLYLSSETLERMEERFGYLLDRFEIHKIDEDQADIGEFRYFTYSQAGVRVNGFRFGDFAYVTDIKKYSDSIFEALKGVDTLVLGSLHHKGSIMHFSFDEAIAFTKKVKPRRTILTHIAHEIMFERDSVSLPTGIEIAYDGMEFALNQEGW